MELIAAEMYECSGYGAWHRGSCTHVKLSVQACGDCSSGERID